MHFSVAFLFEKHLYKIKMWIMKNKCSLLHIVDKTEYMVGSYGPKSEEHEYKTTMEEAPKGMMTRGTYNIKSKFTDDDKHDHLSWEWNLAVKKDWKD